MNTTSNRVFGIFINPNSVHAGKPPFLLFENKGYLANDDSPIICMKKKPDTKNS